MFVVEEILDNSYPSLKNKPFLRVPTKAVLRRMLHEEDCNYFASHYPHLKGMDFVEQVLEYFNFSYTVSDRDRENIPVGGRVVIIANHPIGSLDGLALLKLIHEIRSDVKVVANELLSFVKPLSPCLLPVNNMSGVSKRLQLSDIMSALSSEKAVIIFPAGEVSRAAPTGVKDGKWHKGFLSIATKTGSPILPIHIQGKNSPLFYTASLLCKPVSTLMLVGEMFKQREKQIRFRVGKIIPFGSYHAMPIRTEDKVKLFKKHVYRLGKNKQTIFITESSVALPERKTEIKKYLQQSDLLGRTPDGKQMLLYSSPDTSPVLREIGRLREITFRAVGEGTGKRRDIDNFDRYYQHLILWDEEDLEIVGAYRFIDSKWALENHGAEGLYTGSLFALDPDRHEFIENGLELGRSFIQQRYWGKRSLDYLWYGIGAFLICNPDFRYLFGPVSISNSMPKNARDLLIYFYKLYFSDNKETPCSRNPFRFSQSISELGKEFCGNDYRQDFKKLKSLLANMGTTVPTLYKQYSELCQPGGVRFLDFNVDQDFNNCVDGLVVVDMHKLKEKKRNRYMGNSIFARNA